MAFDSVRLAAPAVAAGQLAAVAGLLCRLAAPWRAAGLAHGQHEHRCDQHALHATRSCAAGVAGPGRDAGGDRQASGHLALAQPYRHRDAGHRQLGQHARDRCATQPHRSGAGRRQKLCPGTAWPGQIGRGQRGGGSSAGAGAHRSARSGHPGHRPAEPAAGLGSWQWHRDCAARHAAWLGPGRARADRGRDQPPGLKRCASGRRNTRPCRKCRHFGRCPSQAGQPAQGATWLQHGSGHRAAQRWPKQCGA